MRHGMCAALVALLLGSCVSSTPAQKVFEAGQYYNGVLTVAVTYESLPRCDPAAEQVTVCSHVGAIELIRKADNVAATALDAAEKIVRDPNVTESKRTFAVESAWAAVRTFGAAVNNFSGNGGT